MIPFWIYGELPLFLLMGTLMRLARCKEKTVLIVWGVIGALAVLGDYFIVAPLLNVYYPSLIALSVAIGACVVVAWMGWQITNKLLERWKKYGQGLGRAIGSPL